MTHTTPKNTIEFTVTGRYALFTNPYSKLNGEKTTYDIPTYESLKGICKSIYWKPTITWYIDKVRVMKKIQTHTSGVKPKKADGSNSLTLNTSLADVEYQVQAHFEFNLNHSNLTNDRNDGKHYSIAIRSIKNGGRQDIFLGTRECQAYVEPCVFGTGAGTYDNDGEREYGIMLHGLSYADETGFDELRKNLWEATMSDGIIIFCRPEDCTMTERVRDDKAKVFAPNENFSYLD